MIKHMLSTFVKPTLKILGEKVRHPDQSARMANICRPVWIREVKILVWRRSGYRSIDDTVHAEPGGFYNPYLSLKKP